MHKEWANRPEHIPEVYAILELRNGSYYFISIESYEKLKDQLSLFIHSDFIEVVDLEESIIMFAVAAFVEMYTYNIAIKMRGLDRRIWSEKLHREDNDIMERALKK